MGRSAPAAVCRDENHRRKRQAGRNTSTHTIISGSSHLTLVFSRASGRRFKPSRLSSTSTLNSKER
jgi:hypothetical protein